MMGGKDNGNDGKVVSAWILAEVVLVTAGITVAPMSPHESEVRSVWSLVVVVTVPTPVAPVPADRPGAEGVHAHVWYPSPPLSGEPRARAPPARSYEELLPTLKSAASAIKHTSAPPSTRRSAVLDDAHVGDIEGAWGTIRRGDLAPCRTF
jgi:hypothetical protein